MLIKFCHDMFIQMQVTRGESRTAETSKVQLFVIIVNGWKPLTIITKSSTLDVAAVLDPLLVTLELIVFSKCKTLYVKL